MSLPSEIRRLARRQLEDYDSTDPGTVFSERQVSLAVDDAYRVQIAMARLRQDRGERVAGYKIGCVSRTIRRQLGIEHPVFGHIFQGEMHNSPALLAADRFCGPAVEGEFAVVLAADVVDPDDVRRDPSPYVTDLFPVIELHNYMVRGPSLSPGELIANNALHAGIVVNSGRGTIDLTASHEIRVEIGGRVEDRAMVDPLATLPELLSQLACYGIAPRRGNVLLTGSPLPLYRVEPGERVRVASPGASIVEAQFLAG